MMLKKLTFTACSLLPFGAIALGGSALIAQQSSAQDRDRLAPASAQNPPPVAAPNAPKALEVDQLIQQLQDAARNRVKVQRAYYEEGRITINRLVDAYKQLEMVELRTAKSDAEPVAIRQRLVNQLKDIENREKADMEAGRGTQADVAEATLYRTQAELDLTTGQPAGSDIDWLPLRWREVERRVDQIEKRQGGQQAVGR
jgi:hypothetical protein